MIVTIKDIAYKAKVSTATVSRVINGSSLVKPATKERVLKVIRELNYYPNVTARSLVNGKSNILTLLVPPGPDFLNAFYFREILRGITSTLSKFHYRLMIYQPPEYDRLLGYAPSINGFQSDGLFIIAPLLEDRLVKRLEIESIPAVLINGRSVSLDWVDLNNLSASIQVVEQLVNLGHKRIGFIGGYPRGQNAIDRLQGYCQGLAQCGLPFDSQLVTEGDYTVDSGYEATKKLLQLSSLPTAIFSANDWMAIGAIRAVREMGLSVPKDISIFGFDDLDIATLSDPPLSTVKQPFFAMGSAATELLIARIENEKSPQLFREFSGELILRQSCGTK